MSVCLSVHLHYSKTTRPNFNFLHVAYGRGPVLLWRRCDTLCTSGFVDDVRFSHNGSSYGVSCAFVSRHSSRILLNDILPASVHGELYTGAKSAIQDCLVVVVQYVGSWTSDLELVSLALGRCAITQQHNRHTQKPRFTSQYKLAPGLAESIWKPTAGFMTNARLFASENRDRSAPATTILRNVVVPFMF